MKSKLAFTLLLFAFSFFPGCYTVLLVEDDTESTLSESPATIVEYVPVYVPGPNPEPILEPSTYIPAPVYINNNPPSAPPTSSDNHREIHTGRSSPDSNPAPARNDENNTRDSGTQRGRR
jgi:hypothetical protein